MKFEFPAKSVSASEIAAVLKNALPDGVFGKNDFLVSTTGTPGMYSINPGTAILNGYVLSIGEPVELIRPASLPGWFYIKLRHDKTLPAGAQFSFVMEAIHAQNDGAVSEMTLAHVDAADSLDDKRVQVRQCAAGQYHFYFEDNSGIKLRAPIGDIVAVTFMSDSTVTGNPAHRIYTCDLSDGHMRPSDGIVTIVGNEIWIKSTVLGGPVPPLFISVYTSDICTIDGTVG